MSQETGKPELSGFVSASQKPVDEVMAQHFLDSKDKERIAKRARSGREMQADTVRKQARVIEEFGSEDEGIHE